MRPPTWKDEYNERFGYPRNDIEEINLFLQKEFIDALLEKQKQNIITLIENEETDYPVRESDEFDEGGRMFKQALLGKLKSK